MSDDTSLRGPQDRTRIALGEENEVRYWTSKWGISRDELADAVKAVGNSAAAVARHLGRSEEDGGRRAGILPSMGGSQRRRAVRK